MTEKYAELHDIKDLNESKDSHHLETQKNEVLIEHMHQTSETQENLTKNDCKASAVISEKNKENYETSPPNNKNLQIEKIRSSDNFLNESPYNKALTPQNQAAHVSSMARSMSFYRLKAQKISENNKNFTHTEIFHQACLERKKASFNSLKNWDLKRAKFLTMHRNILETIHDRLSQHLKKSQSFMQSLIKYLKDRAVQELNYAKVNIEPFESEENQGGGQTNYVDLLKELEVSAQKHQKHCSNVEELGMMIEEKLLGESLIPEKTHYDKIIKEFHESLLRIKKNLTKMNIEASEKSAKYSTLYFTMINAPFGKKTDKDLYRREISFLRIANEQVKFQRKLAVEIFSFWESLKELERKRVEISKKAIESYLMAFNQTYPFLNHNEREKTGFGNEDLMGSLEMREILNQEEINIVISQAKEFQINFDELNVEILKDFFEGFVIKPHGDEVFLIMKEMHPLRDIGGLISNFVECKLILTVDGFLLSIDLPLEENEYKKPSMIVNLETTTSIKIKEVFLVEITRTKPGFLMNSIERFLFKFAGKEEVEEAFEYLNRYYYNK